jgi:DNA-binding transcriptional ArsR family regulator
LTDDSFSGKLANMETAAAIKALANPRRLEILNWLKDPRAHFPPQADGDLIRDGVCSLFIAQKLGVSPSTVSEHLKILSQAGLVRGQRIKQWTFYKRDEKRIAEVKRVIQSAW